VGRVYIAVCLSVFPHESSKNDAIRITKRSVCMWSTMNAGNPFILGS